VSPSPTYTIVVNETAKTPHREKDEGKKSLLPNLAIIATFQS
jgi:hypothetical protein